MKYVLTIIALMLVISCGEKKKSNLGNDSSTDPIENSNSKKAESTSNKKSKKQSAKKAKSSNLIGPSGPQSYAENGITVDYEIHEMELAENTEVVGWNDMDLMTSSEENTFTFGKKASQIKSLKTGQVVVLAGEHVGRVESVNQSGNKITLTTSPATLTDAFETLVMDYDAEINWRELQKSAGLKFGHASQYASMFRSGGPALNDKYALKINGYDVDVKLKTKPAGVLDFTINCVKQAKAANGSLKIGVTANGHVSKMGNKGALDISGSQLKSYTIQNKIQGETTLSFVGVGTGSDIGEIKPELPLFAMPIRVGLIPITLEISLFVSLRPVLVAGGSSKGKYKFTYDTDTGFGYADGNVFNTNEKENITMEPAGEVQSAGVKTVGFGAGVGFPVFKAKVFGNTVVPTTYHQFDGQSLWEPGIMSGLTPCQKAVASSQINASLALNFFGAKYTRSFNVFKEEIDFNPCDD